jgi:SAM-dependent methyltransferase
MGMKNLHVADWEALARHQPYFPVLTHEGSVETESTSGATDAFFQTGEADIEALFSAIATLRGREVVLASSLDFGCGVGRLTLPLAQRSTRVVGCDIAPTMLAHARQNARDADLRNVTFIGSPELTGLPDGKFDFVCSFFVLQYIAPPIGCEIIRALLRVLAPAGVAALHLTFARRGSRLRRFASVIPPTSRHVNGVIRSARQAGRPRAYAEVSEYDEQTVMREIETTGAHLIGRFATGPGDAVGAVLIVERTPR